ncbi:uncharacterized protein V2V93DRAFT_373071 [Kockiozyma suomiensis]|uniref:uncharacterized protein n=1 Tax=Kockiozyma suomiensis TaxID=1337062 RepID=UPI0033433D70
MIRAPKFWSSPGITHHNRGLASHYNWVARNVRKSINDQFNERLKKNLSLVDEFGRVFTAQWRLPPHFQELSNLREKAFRLSLKESPPQADEDLDVLKISLTGNLISVRQRPIHVLKHEAFIDQMVKIYNDPYPPTFPRFRGKERHMLLVNQQDLYEVKNLYKKYQLQSEDDNTSQEIIDKRQLRVLPLEWLIVSNFNIPRYGHDHYDLFYLDSATESDLAVTNRVYSSLLLEGYTVNDLHRWMRCIEADTCEQAIEIMDGHIWIPTLILYLLEKDLSIHTLRQMLAITRRQFSDMDNISQMIALSRLIFHSLKKHPESLPKLARMFVSEISDSARTSFVYNRVLYILSVKTTMNYPEEKMRSCILQAQEIIIEDMETRNITMLREGYLSLAAVLRYDQPQAALNTIATMTRRGMPLLNAGKYLLSIITPAVENNIHTFQVPKGAHCEAVGKILVSADLYSATQIFEGLGPAGEHDIEVWNAMLTKLIEFERLKPESVFKFVDRWNEDNVVFDKYTVQKLMSVLNLAEDGLRLLSKFKDSDLKRSYRVLRSFILCCHRDVENASAMSIALSMVDRMRPNDERLYRLLDSIQSYRRWKLREYRLENLRIAALDNPSYNARVREMENVKL